jgi:hypothetical protein
MGMIEATLDRAETVRVAVRDRRTNLFGYSYGAPVTPLGLQFF